MKTSKSDQCKDKAKSKAACSSKQASRFLEKEGFSGMSLNYKGMAANLSDFIPGNLKNSGEGLELDFEIAKQMKKLEKKDVGTKQKALLDLIEALKNIDPEKANNILRYWPKIYNRLSLNEDKRVRELTQEMMSNLASICGKNLGAHIKQLLPTWIFAQSDIHGPAANIAIISFNNTFDEGERRKKAFLLCWEELSLMINNTLIKENESEKEEVKNIDKDKKQIFLKKEVISEKDINLTALKDQSVTELEEKKDKKQFTQKDASLNKEDKVCSRREQNNDDIVLHMRTLVTLLPYIATDSIASQDLTKWLHSKLFWTHFKLSTCTNVISIYLTLSIDLLRYVPHLVVNVPFIISNITHSFRLIEKYHVNIVPLVWTVIMKSIDIIGDSVWQYVSFQNTFLPKWLKMLECGADGNISLACTFMLPFFTKIPLNVESTESVHVYGRIFECMFKSLTCARVRNISLEANSCTTMTLECATYTVLKARSVSNDMLKESMLFIIWKTLESYMTIPDFNKATKTITYFCHVALRPLLDKQIIKGIQLTETLSSWIHKYNDEAYFFVKLTDFLMELSHLSLYDEELCESIMEDMQVILTKNIPSCRHCLLPYLSIISSYDITHVDNDVQMKHVFEQCKDIIPGQNSSVLSFVALSMAKILNYIPKEAPALFQYFLTCSSSQTVQVFFQDCYDVFINHVNADIRLLLTTKSLDFWTNLLSTDLEQCVEDNNKVFSEVLSFIFHHCLNSPHHILHLSHILSVLDSQITRMLDARDSADNNDVVIHIVKYCIEEIEPHMSFDVIPQSMVLNLVRALISSPLNDRKVDLSQLRLYLESCTTKDIFLSILDMLLQREVAEYHLVAVIVHMMVQVSPEIFQTDLLHHIDLILLSFMTSLEDIVQHQQRYSLAVVPDRQSSLILITHTLQALLHLQYDLEPCLDHIKESVTHCSVLVAPILVSTFSDCLHSTHILQQCDSIFTFTDTMASPLLHHVLDLMLLSAQPSHSKANIFDHCPSLTLLGLKHFISPSYSHWSHNILSAVDFALNSWTEASLSERELYLMFNVLFPCALRARYLVQEVILASISVFLREDSKVTLWKVNRAMALVQCLTSTDPSYFHACYPLLMSAKDTFQSHLDQLYDASVHEIINQDSHFLLSSLLQVLIVGVDCPSLDNSHWDFILCIISTLCRSAQFINSPDHAVNTIHNNVDHLFNSYLLLRLISVVSVSLASINNDSVLDEWDNLFSEPIFTTVLDLFSFVSGNHSHGKLVSSDLFIFYTEALAEAVSLCPVSVLLAHNFHVQVHINDPIDLPKDFLVVFNSLLESLSSYSLSTQLAAYNCLLNLTETLSTLMSSQLSKVEKDDSLESFSLTLPHKLLSYLQCDDLLQLCFDKVDNDIVLIRSFLAWNVLLQLFSCSQAKLRAELTSFLITHDCCFDKFLSFCFTFMPKNPLINKKTILFLSNSGRGSCNLISEEPAIFSKCLEHRSSFTLYHLSSYLFIHSLQVLPNLTRVWFTSLDLPSQQQVDTYVRLYITPQLMKMEFDQLNNSVVSHFDDKLQIKTLPVIGEVSVRYIVSEDQCLEQVISLPNNYPIGKITVDFKKELKVKIAHWKSWIIQMTSIMENQNGSILDGVKLWKKNLDKHFAGAEDCMICYSILHAIKYSLPSMKCRQCKKKFHKECMFKWFQSSTNPTCPNCRHVFYGRTQYGDNDA